MWYSYEHGKGRQCIMLAYACMEKVVNISCLLVFSIVYMCACAFVCACSFHTYQPA